MLIFKCPKSKKYVLLFSSASECMHAYAVLELIVHLILELEGK